MMIMPNFGWIALVVFVQCSCFTANVSTAVNTEFVPPTPVQTRAGKEPNDEAYVIYSQVILNNDMLRSSSLCIANQTTFGNVMPGSTLEDVRETLQTMKSPGIDALLVESYVRENESAHVLQNRFVLPVQIRLVETGSNIKEIGCGVYLRFSGVAFSQDSTKALLYVETYSGPKSASGTFITFNKVKEKWISIEQFGIWAS
jgi:hypothetical protein